MLPSDPYREEKAIDSPVPPGLVNKLQRGAEIEAASGDDPTTAKPTDPTWGGGQWRFGVSKTGLIESGGGAGEYWTIDDSIDYRKRFILAFGYAYDDPDLLPGESSPLSRQPGADVNFDGMGAAVSGICAPCMGYLNGTDWAAVNLAGSAYTGEVVLGTDGDGKLRMRYTGTTRIYPVIFFLVTDQFPTRG